MKLPRHQIRRAALIPDEQTLNDINQVIQMATKDNHQLVCPVRGVHLPASENQVDKSKQDGQFIKKTRIPQDTLN